MQCYDFELLTPTQCISWQSDGFTDGQTDRQQYHANSWLYCCKFCSLRVTNVTTHHGIVVNISSS